MLVKAALLLFRNYQHERQLLFVRAKGKAYYIFPGGKQEVGESIVEALLRELKEELAVGATDLHELGKVIGATPDARPLTMHLYSAKLTGSPTPNAEIEELRWLSKAQVLQQKSVMTPMTLNHILPFLDREKLW